MITLVSCVPNVRVRPPRPFQWDNFGVPPGYLPGEDITTSDGQTWFHPYDGSSPWQLKDRAHGR